MNTNQVLTKCGWFGHFLTISSRETIISAAHKKYNQRSQEKKNWPYFPLNTGCLIGILIIFYYNPLYKWVGFHPSIVSKNPRPYQENLKKIMSLSPCSASLAWKRFFSSKASKSFMRHRPGMSGPKKKRMEFPHIDSVTKKNLAQGCFESNWMMDKDQGVYIIWWVSAHFVNLLKQKLDLLTHYKTQQGFPLFQWHGEALKKPSARDVHLPRWTPSRECAAPHSVEPPETGEWSRDWGFLPEIGEWIKLRHSETWSWTPYCSPWKFVTETQKESKSIVFQSHLPYSRVNSLFNFRGV